MRQPTRGDLRLLAVKGVAKRIGSNTILRDVSFTLESGACLVVHGPNGAGKTTLLRLIVGASRPSSGVINIAGSQFSRSRPQLRAMIGYLAHEPFLHPELTGAENLTFHARVQAVADPGRRIELALEQWGLSRVAHRLTRTYSRGMKQRLALARTFLSKPLLVLLDEPFTGLDAEARNVFVDCLTVHLRSGGIAIITSHDQVALFPEGAIFALLDGGCLVWRR